MSERAESSEIFLLALVASAISVAAITLLITLSVFIESSSPDIVILLLWPVTFAFGLLVAIFTSVPLGFAVGWIIGLTGPVTELRIALAGAVTGASFGVIAAKVTDYDRDVDLRYAVLAIGFAVLGAAAVWVAFRFVLRMRTE